jgi:hypothetical protein
VELGIKGSKYTALVDTGSTINLIDEQTAAHLRTTRQAHTRTLSRSIPLLNVNGGISFLTETLTVEFSMGGETFKGKFHVAPVKIGYPFILGLTFLRTAKPLVNWDELSLSFATTIPPYLMDFADVFDVNNPIPLPVDDAKHGVKFRINTLNGKLPPPATPYPMSPADRAEEDKQLHDLLEAGRVRPSSSPTAAACFFVNKQCEGCNQLKCTCGKRAYKRRWVIDFRPLNALTPQDAYPLPSAAELRTIAPGHKHYTKFDIEWAFHNVPVAEEDRHKTAFVTSRGLFEWCVMMFGPKNAPATFQRMIDTVLTPVRHFCRAFMDDGIIWADTTDQLVSRTRTVFQLLRDAGLRVKLKKSEFDVPEVPYLGHIIGEHGARTDPAKLQGILDHPEPRTKSDIRSFLGLVGYYREYFPQYSDTALPLTDATANSAPNHYPGGLPSHLVQCFNKIKNYWSSPHNLAPYIEEDPVDLYTDASTRAWGAVIEQHGKPLAFLSGKFTAAEQNWPTTDRELFACLQAHKRAGHLLSGPKVTWYTDHSALKALRTTLTDSPRRINWREYLDRFPFTIKHIAGKKLHVDGMTRHSTWEAIQPDGDWLVDPSRWDPEGPRTPV